MKYFEDLIESDQREVLSIIESTVNSHVGELFDNILISHINEEVKYKLRYLNLKYYFEFDIYYGNILIVKN